MSSNALSVSMPPGRDSQNRYVDADGHALIVDDSETLVRNDSRSSSITSHHKPTFCLSMSDLDGAESESASVCDDLGSTNSLYFGECDAPAEASVEGAFKNQNLRLSAILGISADERIERQLAQQLSEDSASAVAEPNPEIKTNTSFDVDREFDYLKVGPARRCASLRTGGKPSATKKSVRFADALGLELQTVRDIANMDEPPHIPLSALFHLTLKDVDAASEDNVKLVAPALVCKMYFCFSQPCRSPDFTRRVVERKVLLESCVANDALRQISGVVRVANVNFHKRVAVRSTTNGWLTFEDSDAAYLAGSRDGATDCFSFLICLPEYFGFGNRLEFSIRYEAGDETFWDSNFGGNYRVECNMVSSELRAGEVTRDIFREAAAYHPFY